MRRQVALLVAASTSLVLLAFLVPLAVLLGALAEDRAVGDGLQEAQGLAAVVAAVADDPPRLELAVQLAEQSSARDVSVVLPDGRSLGATLPPGPGPLALAAQGRSFVADVDGGREVLVPVDVAQGRAVVRSFVPAREVREGVRAAVGVLALLGVGLLGVAVLVADRLGRGFVRPVGDLARTTTALAEGDLTARVEPAGPREVREVGARVNALGTRIGELLAAERERAADLSHRLRTPLTALRLEAEGLGDRTEAGRVSAGVDALERVVDDVIRSARRPAREGVQARCDAGRVVAERAAFWQVLAEDQGRAVHLDVVPVPAPVRLAAEDLAAAVDALLENVLSHTPDGSPLDVQVARREASVAVTVGDRGPGLSAQALRRGHSGGGSTGLGLDIARRTAEAAGGHLELSGRPGGGALVAMVLPYAGGPGD